MNDWLSDNDRKKLREVERRSGRELIRWNNICLVITILFVLLLIIELMLIFMHVYDIYFCSILTIISNVSTINL